MVHARNRLYHMVKEQRTRRIRKGGSAETLGRLVVRAALGDPVRRETYHARYPLVQWQRQKNLSDDIGRQCQNDDDGGEHFKSAMGTNGLGDRAHNTGTAQIAVMTGDTRRVTVFI